MSYDVVALVAGRPDERVVIDALQDLDQDLCLHQHGDRRPCGRAALRSVPHRDRCVWRTWHESPEKAQFIFDLISERTKWEIASRFGRPVPTKELEAAVIVPVRAPENYSVEEPVLLYEELAFEKGEAEAHARLVKNPVPEGHE